MSVSSGLINYKGFDLNDTPDLTGKVCVITGGQGGIGKEMVAQLLHHRISKVYVLAKSMQKFGNACQYWEETHKFTTAQIQERVAFMSCDLQDVTIVKKVADNLKKELTRLDMLIANAGMPFQVEYTNSPQGIETVFAANVVGHFTLINLLMPLLEKTAEQYGDARVALASSSLHAGCQELNFDLIMSKEPVKTPKEIDSCWRYCRSKLGVILLTREFARRLDKKGTDKVYVNTYFPGNIPTDAMTPWKELFGPFGAMLKGAFMFIGQNLKDASATAIYLSTSPEVVKKNEKGKYFIPIGTEDTKNTTPIAKDDDLARNLWAWCDTKVSEALGKDWIDEEGSGLPRGTAATAQAPIQPKTFT